MEKEQEYEPHPDYVQGFNEGYFIAQEMPQFASDMAKYMPESERGNGFGKGVEEFARDQLYQKQRESKDAFKDNKSDLGVDKNSRENIARGFNEMKSDMGFKTHDRHTAWLSEVDTNRQDMGVSKEPDKELPDREPDME